MAGTRLLLSVVFLIEIPLLIIVALWSATNTSKDKVVKWHPDHQPFLPNRKGLDRLQKFGFSQKLAELQDASNVFSWHPSFHVDVFVYCNDDNEQRPSANDQSAQEKAVFQSLNQSIHERIIQSKFSSVYNVEVSSINSTSNPEKESNSSKLDLLLVAERICTSTGIDPLLSQETLWQNMRRPISSSQYNALGYIPVIVATGCTTESQMYISETGSVLVTFHNNLSRNDIFHLLETQVSSVVHHQVSMSYETLHRLSQQQRAPSVACSKVILSLVDPDPSSHSIGGYQDAIEHTQRLNHVLVNVTKEYVIPFLVKLSEYSNMTLYTQHLPYHGQDILSHVKRNEYTDDTVDYTLSTMDVRQAVLNGDLAYFTQGFVPPYVEEVGSSDDGCVNVFQLILYVARGDMTPMYVLEEVNDRWSTAFALSDRNLAMSIMNIAPHMDVKGDYNGAESDNNATSNSMVNNASKDLSNLLLIDELDNLYYSQARDSVAYLASYVRQHMALMSPQPYLTMDNSSSDSKEDILRVYRERPKDGVAQWEVDLLIRNTMHSKITHILNSLENVHDLIQVRHGLSVPEKSAMKILQCMDEVQGALDIMSSMGDIRSVNRRLNDGLRLLRDITTDEEMFELPHTPLDQLFALFGSLLLPLFVPIVKNFISELKRYKSISKPKQKTV